MLSTSWMFKLLSPTAYSRYDYKVMRLKKPSDKHTRPYISDEYGPLMLSHQVRQNKVLQYYSNLYFQQCVHIHFHDSKLSSPILYSRYFKDKLRLREVKWLVKCDTLKREVYD